MIIKNPKTTREDQRYFDNKAKIIEAHREGKLGKEWYQYNPKTGKHELKPKRIYKRV